MSRAAENGSLPADSRREELAEIIRHIAILRSASDQAPRPPRTRIEADTRVEGATFSPLPDPDRDAADLETQLDALVARAGALVMEIAGPAADESPADRSVNGVDSPPDGPVRFTPRQRERRLLHRRIVELIEEVDRIEAGIDPAPGPDEMVAGSGLRPEAESMEQAAGAERESQLRALLNHALELEAALIDNGRSLAEREQVQAVAVARPEDAWLPVGAVGETSQPGVYAGTDVRTREVIQSVAIASSLEQGGLSVRIIQPTARPTDEGIAGQDLTLVFEGVGQQFPLRLSMPVHDFAAGRAAGHSATIPGWGSSTPLLATLSILAFGMSLLVLAIVASLWVGAIAIR